MTVEAIKRTLTQCGELQAECCRLRDYANKKQETLDYLREQLGDGRIRRDDIARDAEEAAGQLENTLRLLAQQISGCEQAEQEIWNMLDCVDDPVGRSILFMRYMEGRAFGNIADELGVSLRTVFNRYNRAIGQIQTAYCGKEVMT